MAPVTTVARGGEGFKLLCGEGFKLLCPHPNRTIDLKNLTYKPKPKFGL